MSRTLGAVILFLGMVSATLLAQQNLERESCTPISIDDWSRWRVIIDFRPPQDVLATATASGWVLQTIDDGVGIFVNLDQYLIDISILPTVGGHQLTPSELLETIRVNLPLFVSAELARFTPVDPSAKDGWAVGKPGAQMEFGILAAGEVAAPAHVLLAERSNDHWRFVTGHKNSTRHPVSGVREFGFTSKANGQGVLLFTRGVDRISSFSWRHVGRESIFRGGDAMWRSFQERVAAFVNARGGEARILEPYSRRHCWDDVAKYRRGPSAPANLRITR